MTEVSGRLRERQGTTRGGMSRFKSENTLSFLPSQPCPSNLEEPFVTTWNLNGTRHIVLICNGGTCAKAGADDVTLALRKELSERGLDPEVHTARTRCLGRCEDACSVSVQPENVWYGRVDEDVVRKIVTEHLESGRPVGSHVTFRHLNGVMEQVGGHQPGEPKPGGEARV